MVVVKGADNGQCGRTTHLCGVFALVAVCILVMPRHVPGPGVVSGQTMWASHAPLWDPSSCCLSRCCLHWPPCHASSCPYPIFQPHRAHRVVRWHPSAVPPCCGRMLLMWWSKSPYSCRFGMYIQENMGVENKRWKLVQYRNAKT